MNNIDIRVTDASNIIIAEFDDLGENFFGVFTGNFNLSTNMPAGTIKIRSIIDRNQQTEVIKEIEVQNFKTPQFRAHISVSDKYVLANSIINLNFYADYSFNHFVRGDAQLTIKCTTLDETDLTKQFNNITGVYDFQYKVNDNFNVSTKLDFEAEIKFTEPTTGLTAIETTLFTVHADNKPKIVPNHPQKYMPGLPFPVKVFIYDWKDELIENSQDDVKIIYELKLSNGKEKEITINADIVNGVAVDSLNVPKRTEDFKFRIEYLGASYERIMEKGFGFIEVNKLVIDHWPKK